MKFNYAENLTDIKGHKRSQRLHECCFRFALIAFNSNVVKFEYDYGQTWDWGYTLDQNFVLTGFRPGILF